MGPPSKPNEHVAGQAASLDILVVLYPSISFERTVVSKYLAHVYLIMTLWRSTSCDSVLYVQIDSEIFLHRSLTTVKCSTVMPTTTERLS